MLIQQTLIQYLLQKKNLCEIFKVLTIWGNINLFIRPQHQVNMLSILKSIFLSMFLAFYQYHGLNNRFFAYKLVHL